MYSVSGFALGAVLPIGLSVVRCWGWSQGPGFTSRLSDGVALVLGLGWWA